VKKQDERLQKRSVRRAGKKAGKRADKRQRKRQAGERAGADQYRKGAREALWGSAQLLGRMADSFAGWAGQAAMEIVTRLNRGGKIMCCGNGGSAADAQHIAAELSGKFYLNRRALPAVSITTNPSSVTAISNDYGYEHVFSKQIEGLGRSGDVLLAFSTSGGSPNVLRAVGLARKMGIFVIGFTGAGGAAFARKCDMCLVVPSLDCPRIQEAHIAVGHSICFLVERAIFGGK
jgi:D-sedoheptulose 7-phosphate isomerase